MNNQQRIARLLQLVELTEPTECDCSHVYDIMDEAAELVASGADLSAIMPEVMQHFEHCGCCRSEFETLKRILADDDALVSNAA